MTYYGSYRSAPRSSGYRVNTGISHSGPRNQGYNGNRVFQLSTRSAHPDTVQAWREAFPTASAWLDANAATNEFAASLLSGLLRFGRLTDGQLAAVQRNLQPREVRPTTTVDVSRIAAAFDTARAAGLRRIKVTINGITLSPAPATGRNPGAIYVKDNGLYVGKISEGVFAPGRDFGNDPTTLVRLQEIAANPLAAAQAHGHQTGDCSCCGRTLTDPSSVANGIGPICAGKFGWGRF